MTVFLDENSRRGVDRLTSDVLASTPGDLYTAALGSFIKNEQSDSAAGAKGDLLASQFRRAQALGIDLPRSDHLNPFDPLGNRELILQRPSERGDLRFGYDEAVRRANDTLAETPDEESFLTVFEIETRVLEEAVEARERAEEVRSMVVPGFQSTLAEFGAVGVGVITDPINVLAFTAVAPIALQSLGTAILLEGATGLVSEAIIQTKVVPFLMEQGMSREEALALAAEKVISAGVFGGLFGGLGFGVFKLGAAAFRKFRRGDAKVIDQVLDGLDAKREQLTPDQRDALDVLKEVREAERTAPFKSRDPDAVGEHLENLAAAEEAAKAGRPVDLPHESIIERTEAGAQRVIPGAERISERELAERGIAAPLRAKKGQLAADEGLFDVAARRQIDIVDEARRLAREAKTEPEDELDRLLNELRTGRAPGGKFAKKPQTLNAFVKRIGGVRDESGELAARDMTPKTAKGLVKKKAGLPADEVGLQAFEAGFFRERPLISELFEAMGDEFAGRRPLIRPRDEPLVVHEEILEEFGRELDELGIDLKAMSNAEVRQRLDAAARAAPAIDELAGLEGDPLKAARAVGEMADNIPARIRELEDLMAQADEIGIGGREAIEVDLDTLEIPLPDGRIVTARKFFELQKEKDKIVDAFFACVGIAL